MKCSLCEPDKIRFRELFSHDAQKKNVFLCEKCSTEEKSKPFVDGFHEGALIAGITIFVYPIIMLLLGDYWFLVNTLIFFISGYLLMKLLTKKYKERFNYNDLNERKEQRRPLYILGFVIAGAHALFSLWAGFYLAIYI